MSEKTLIYLALVLGIIGLFVLTSMSDKAHSTNYASPTETIETQSKENISNLSYPVIVSPEDPNGKIPEELLNQLVSSTS